MFCKTDVREIKYRKDSDADVYKCLIYVSTGTYRPKANIIWAKLYYLKHFKSNHKH